MKKNEAREIIKKHNESIDNYINIELAKELNAKDGKISINQWFKAQQFINAQHFYEKGMAILNDLRNQGFDVKMNMQSNKLVL